MVPPHPTKFRFGYKMSGRAWLAQLVRSLLSDHKVSSSILSSAEIWIFVQPYFSPRPTQLSILLAGAWRGKMGIWIDRFLAWENGALATGNGKKIVKIKNGNEIWELWSGIWKKYELGNGIGTLPPFSTLFWGR